VKSLLNILVLAFLCNIVAAESKGPTMKDYDWWRNARFGVFMHWGPASVLALGGGSWDRACNPQGNNPSTNSTTPGKLPSEIADNSYMEYFSNRKGNVPQKIYDNLYQVFNPVKFNAEKLIANIKNAGAKYIVFTTKHHDGFCMFDSKYTDYDIMNTPYAKDILKQLTDACHKAGIKVIFYYSKPDWYDTRYNPADPKPYEEYMVNQITELCTKYGEVKGFWWDGGNRVNIDGKKVFDAIMNNQPGAIYNGRGGMNLPGIAFATPEQKLGEFNRGWPWESCVTVQGEGWFWNGGKNMLSLDSCIQLLISAIVGDGNLLLDFGPTKLGTMPATVRSNLRGMGEWTRKYGEAIYGTRGGPYKPGTWGGATCKGNNIYLHINQEWPSGVLTLPALPAKVLKATSLSGGTPTFIQKDKKLIIKLDPKYHDSPDTVIKLEIDKNAVDLQPIKSEDALFVSLNASVTASSENANWRGWAGSVALHDFEVNMPKTTYFGEDSGPSEKPEPNHNYKPTKEVLNKYPWIRTKRDHIWRYWVAKSSDQQPWLEIDFGKPKTFNKITMLEKFNRIKVYQLEYLKDGKWIVFSDGTGLGSKSIALEKPITAQKVRLHIFLWGTDDVNSGPGMREFDFWYDTNATPSAKK
jgi:alpha-L-fucosidase